MSSAGGIPSTLCVYAHWARGLRQAVRKIALARPSTTTSRPKSMDTMSAASIATDMAKEGAIPIIVATSPSESFIPSPTCVRTSS